MRVRLKGINRVPKKRADGSRVVYYYHRATSTRLPGEPGSHEFMAAYNEAEATIQPREPGRDFAGLVWAFTGSIEFGKLAPGTQAEYRRMLRRAEAEFGGLPIAALDDPQVRRDLLGWRETVAKASGEREADNRLSAASAMLTWGVERFGLVANHIRGFRRLYRADRAEIIWLPEHIEAFMAVAPVELQRAMVLALHTGQRQADLLKLPWSAYDGACIQIRQGKARRGGAFGPLITIPCTLALRSMLDAMDKRSPLILTTKTGLALKKRYFARQWEAATKAAGLTRIILPGRDEPVALHFHDLRGTAVTMLSEAGSTPQQVGTITGHTIKSVNSILERYLARTKGLAEAAILAFENSPRTDFANRIRVSANQPANGGAMKAK